MWGGLSNVEFSFISIIAVFCVLNMFIWLYNCVFVPCPICKKSVNWYANKNTCEDKTYTIKTDEWDETSKRTKRNLMVSYEIKKSLQCVSCKHTFLSSFNKKIYSKWYLSGISFNAKECKNCTGGSLAGYTMDSYGNAGDDVIIPCIRCKGKSWILK